MLKRKIMTEMIYDLFWNLRSLTRSQIPHKIVFRKQKEKCNEKVKP